MKNKKIIRLAESDLHNIIKTSVEWKIIRENHNDASDIDEFNQLRKILGDDTIISELVNYMSGDEFEDFINHIKRYYDL